MTPFTQPTATPEGADLDPGLWDAYLSLTAKITDLEAARTQIRERIEHALGDFETGLVAGRPVVTWKWGKPPQRLDSKRLRAEQPEIYAAYMVTGEPSRSFRLVAPK